MLIQRRLEVEEVEEAVHDDDNMGQVGRWAAVRSGPTFRYRWCPAGRSVRSGRARGPRRGGRPGARGPHSRRCPRRPGAGACGTSGVTSGHRVRSGRGCARGACDDRRRVASAVSATGGPGDGWPDAGSGPFRYCRGHRCRLRRHRHRPRTKTGTRRRTAAVDIVYCRAAVSWQFSAIELVVGLS